VTTRRSVMAAAFGAAALVAACSAWAQLSDKLPRVAAIIPGDPDNSRRSAFREAMRERGWHEGRNVLFEFRSVEVEAGPINATVRELIGLRPDVIVAGANAVIGALKQATQSTPIVMALVADPVGAGFVASLARPGGNVTGLSNLAEGLSAKRLEILREIAPGISRVAVLRNATIPAHRMLLSETEAAARAMDLNLMVFDYRSADDLQEAFRRIAESRAGGLIVLPDAVTSARRALVVSLAERRGLVTMYAWGEFPEAGGLVSYGPSPGGLWRQAAGYVDRILKGARPADLPVEQPTRIELVISQKTARAIGVRIPQAVLVRADRVIE